MRSMTLRQQLAHRHRFALTALGSVGIGVLVILALAGRWQEFAAAAAGASVWVLVIAVALHLVSLLARSESWNVCIGAAGGTADRRRIYRAASVGYVGNIANGQLGFAMRIAALRRSAPRETPGAMTLAATEAPIVLIEVTLAVLTSFTLVGPLGLAWWTPLAAFAVMFAVLVGVRSLARQRGTGWLRGLAVIREARGRNLVIGLVLGAICAQIARNWLLLEASGAQVSVFDATAVLIAVAVLGVLPLGPSVGAGAAVLILGANGVPAVAAAGALLTATGAVAALAYAGWALADSRWSARATVLRRLSLARVRAIRRPAYEATY